MLKIAEKIKNRNGALNRISESTSETINLTGNIENKDQLYNHRVKNNFSQNEKIQLIKL